MSGFMAIVLACKSCHCIGLLPRPEIDLTPQNNEPRYGGPLFFSHLRQQVLRGPDASCLVDEQQRACLGVLGGKWYVGVPGGGWWRYALPGFGDIKWGQYIGHLREVGYKGVLSIEHEDSTFGPEEGFRHGAHYLDQFCHA